MSRKRGGAAQGNGPEAFWSSAEPEEIAERLGSPDLRLDPAIARAIRDRAAGLLLADPSRGCAISSALLRAARREAATLDSTTRAIVWRCHAEACLLTGRIRSAQRAYETAATAAEHAGQQQLLGQILVGRVHVLSLIGAGTEAAAQAKRAERLLKRTGDPIYLGKLYMNRGNALYQTDRYAKAYEAYHKAARVFERAGLRDATWVGLLVNQAIACTNLSRIEEARDIFLRAEAECQRLNLESLCAHARYDRAFLEALRGDYRQALALLEQAGVVFERHDIRDMTAATQRARAEIYLELGMPAEARELAGAAAKAFAAQGMGLDAVLARVNEARGLLLSGRAEEATPILAEAGRFYQRRRVRHRRAAVLLEQARGALLLKNHGPATRLARRAVRVFADLGMWWRRSEADRVLAEILLARGEASQAERALTPALADARRQTVGERLELWALAGRISRARGRRKEAAQRLQRAVGYLEDQRRLIPGPELRARAFENRVRVYHDLLSLALEARAPRFDLLFQLAEASRGRGFRDRMGAAPARARKDVTAKRARLGSLVRRLEEAECAEKGTPDLAKMHGLQTQVRSLEKEISDRIRRVEGTRPGAAAWRGTVGAELIAKHLPRDETLVEYLVVGEQILALVLGHSGRSFRVLPDATATVRALADRVNFQLDAMALSPAEMPGDPAFLRRAAEESLGNLHTALLKPLDDLLPAEGRLILVPHRFLHRVPFECLWDGNDYIDARYVISRCPTADFLLRRTRRGRSRKRAVTICGTVRSGPAAVASEIEAVASLFSSRETRILRDPTSAEILAAMPRSRVLHLSTHGVFREDNPLFSRLTTGDGAIFLADLLGSRLSAELVVLSACNSGRVFTGQGDDLSGVAHGFLAAGARQLLASMWRVHDEATRTLMEAFYRHYTRGATRGDPARALTAAGRETRRNWNHPFYWGSFSVHGA